MPSKDNFRARKDANLSPSDPGKRSVTERKGPVREMSAPLLRLARRTGKNPDVLAAEIPPDTLRRLKYAVLEQENEDGTRTWKHNPMIEEGRNAEVRP